MEKDAGVWRGCGCLERDMGVGEKTWVLGEGRRVIIPYQIHEDITH